MNPVSLDINGRRVTHEVAARTHLGDFLRDTVRLTGTHLGCEHGVCGACTVLLDGVPVRSCITFAAACEGRQVTTVEGYDADPIMQRLRAAFTRHHALQCGFCTPGMLATARDIVLRPPQADEPRVRLELSGNLCRCTGYMGIVAAILDVLDQLQREPDEEVETLRAAAARGKAIVPMAAAREPVAALAVFEPIIAMGTAASAASARPGAAATPSSTSASSASATPGTSSSPAGTNRGNAAAEVARSELADKGMRIDGSFDLPFPAERVWQFMGDLPAVAGCLPGAVIESQEGERVKGRIAIKFGPMSAAFAGAARLERDDAAMSAVLRGAGQDSLSKSRAQGDVGYRLERLGEADTRVHVDLVYALQGPLAQFSRSGLVRDFVRRMIADFGRNVGQRLGGGAEAATTAGPAPQLDPLKTLFAILRDRLRALFGGRR
ncbi:MAG: 2Fe-2S iron-sulfur cluster binding domain-containing protein [Burkholderiales bacterium]|nr:2Fe-2S iron-sulfur cluster binding domain-containing protein [Burkholderiales bacterium]